jgi:purine catabolism regulator
VDGHTVGGGGGCVLTVREVLDMAVVRNADPEVLAGDAGLDRPVRWVHTTELADIGPLLRGGDLVLTTGIALPDHGAALAAFVSSLVDSRAVGLFVELGRRWESVPGAVVDECDRLGLPLVALRREVRFATLTQAVGERLVDGQLAALREAEQVHDTFTELSMAEAGPEQILASAQRLAGAPVVLENAQHRVLDFRSGPGDVDRFLDHWERRSQRVRSTGRTVWDHSNGWLVTRVGRQERGWGRLVIGAPTEPPQRLVTVAERAAAALAMHLLHDRTRQGRVRRLHQELLLGVLADPGDADLARRVGVAGLPTEGRTLVGVALRPQGTTTTSGGLAARLDELVAACLHGVETGGAGSPVQALVAAFETDVRLLVSLPRRLDAVRAVDRLVRDVRTRAPAVAAAGTGVESLRGAGRSLREAMHVLEALAGREPDHGAVRGAHRLEDVHLRGLLALLADDDRVQDFVDRELGALRAADARDGTDLLAAARCLVEHWGSKSAAASALNVSRPVLYDRLHRIERVLGADLSDAERRASLHVALVAADLDARP